MIRLLFVFLGFLIFLFHSVAVFADLSLEGFQEVKSTHFVVKFLHSDQAEFARKTLDRAEYFYERIARDIGYSRYDKYWTWDKRAGIVLFPDAISYSRFTGQPQWSKGYASRDSKFFFKRLIVTFNGQVNFLEEVLPHELAHLILWDYFDRTLVKVPVWFEEGIAQLQEAGKIELARAALVPLVQEGRHIPFHVLEDLHPTELQGTEKISVFYAQSLSIVLFLREKYGQDGFYRLSKELREGRSMEQALPQAYKEIIISIEDLEKRWIRYILDQ